MPTLLSFLGPEHNYATQTSAGDFIKAIITVSANASQNEQACIGPNELTRQLVSTICVRKLIGYMLGGGNALTVGVGIIIEVIRKNNSDYDPDVGPDSNALPSSRDPIYLGTLLRLFADHVPDFMNLISINPTQKQRLDSTFGEKIEPLGFDRFKTCELMAELLHCSNMALLNEVGSEQVIALRDEERQRLRADGRLVTNRGEEVQSSEDLTMRMHHASPDDSRRLEVTNASDDDGFEEVTPLGEMTEDTSHEFVKAEDEIPTGPVSAFLDREDDDFVEEPLSSPRLNAHDSKINEQQFENPELVVAPLSPKKPRAIQQPIQKEDNGPTTSEEPVTEASQTEQDSPEGVNPSVSAGIEGAQSHIASEELSTTARDTAESSSNSKAQTGESIIETTAVDSTSMDHDLDTTSDKPPPLQVGDAGVAPDIQPGEAPATIPQQPEERPLGTVQPLSPVVGDYLKMQFVEYQVVPTILVSNYR